MREEEKKKTQHENGWTRRYANERYNNIIQSRNGKANNGSSI